MRRTGRLFEFVVERENLRLATWKALRGNRHGGAARAFQQNLEKEIADLRRLLLDGSFAFGLCRQFLIRDPKERIITAPRFAERVVHHAVMNVTEPHFERWLIADTYACRTGKGREAAVLRARRFAGRFRWFVKLDVRKYFESVPHDRLLELLARRFKDDRLLGLFGRIVRNHRGAEGRGLPIGSLTSPHLANFYLGWLDRYAKEVLRLPAYVRYMDDIAFWGVDPDSMRARLVDVKAFLADRLGLAVKPDAYWTRTAAGMDYLGCRVYPTHATLNRRSRRRFVVRLTSLSRAFARGEIGQDELQRRSTALSAFACAADAKSWRFRRQVVDCFPVDGQ